MDQKIPHKQQLFDKAQTSCQRRSAELSFVGDADRERARARLEARQARLNPTLQSNTYSRKSEDLGYKSQARANTHSTPARQINFKVVLLVSIIAISALLLGMRVYSLVQEELSSYEVSQQGASGQSAEEPLEELESQIDREALAYIMGNDLATQMVLLSASDSDLRWIAMNPEALAVDGARAQNKLLKLATLEPTARSFVRNYPDLYPDDSPEACDSLSEDVDIPLLMQWDQRWGYTVYSGAAFGQTGCCPTSLAMVYQGITRKTDMSPYDMGVLAKQNGFVSEYNGTDGQFLVTCGQQLGLAASEISVSSDALNWALSEGYVVIVNVGPGDFTEGGHFIVATGLAGNGEVVINDPYSVERSERTWTVETIVSQSRAFYMFAR